MRRRSAGLALLSLALVLPATASARPKAAAAAPANVLVVTSTTDALSAAGIASIQAGAASGNYTVNAPTPANVGAQFTPAALDTYRAVVFLNTGIASPLTDAQRANFEAYFRKGGAYVGIGSAVETDSSWQFLTDVLGTRASGRTDVTTGTVKVYDRVHDATKSAPGVLGSHRQLLQLHDQRPRRLARAGHGRRGSVRAAARRQHAEGHHRRHDGRRPPGLLLQGLPGRALVLHHARQHGRVVRREPDHAPQGRDQAGRRVRATRSTATAAPPC